MRLFFACSTMVYRYQLIENDVKNILFAYPYAKENLLKYFDEYLTKVEGVNLLLDSGAFSVWTLGKQIKLEDYIDFCKKVMKRYEGKLNSIEVVNLDVIPGKPGTRPTLSEVEESAKIGRENYQAMVKAGIPTLPVFHQHEDFKWLELMKQDTDYIGISPANDIDTKNRMVWMDNVYANLKSDYKTHSFGGIADSILQRYPLFSGDSSSWTNWGRWGKGTKFHLPGNFTHEAKAIKHLMKRDIAEYKKTEEFITRLWESRGISWE